MSGTGAPPIEVENGSGLRVGIVSAQWHEPIIAGLLAGAQRALAEAGVIEPTLLKVPGVFELPVAVMRLVNTGCDAVIALGVVIRGETPHFDYICQAAAIGLTTVATHTGVPIGFGVLTCDSEEQAWARAGLPDSHEDKGFEAATAALATAVALTQVGST